MQDWNATFERNKAAAAQYKEEYNALSFWEIPSPNIGEVPNYPFPSKIKKLGLLRKAYEFRRWPHHMVSTRYCGGGWVRKYVQYNHHTMMF
jgi:hypothetical protein